MCECIQVSMVIFFLNIMEEKEASFKNIHIGIDLSIHSTGIYVSTGDSSGHFFLILSSKKHSTKTVNMWKAFYVDICKINKFPITVLFYDYASSKEFPNDDKEDLKTRNVISIYDIIEKEVFKKVIGRVKKDSKHNVYIKMEAIAMSGTGTIDQLAGLNYMVRNGAHKNFGVPIDNIILVSPTALKKDSVGCGKADKQVMVDNFKLVFEVASGGKNKDNYSKKVVEMLKILNNTLKWDIDDLADAYYLSRYSI